MEKEIQFIENDNEIEIPWQGTFLAWFLRYQLFVGIFTIFLFFIFYYALSNLNKYGNIDFLFYFSFFSSNSSSPYFIPSIFIVAYSIMNFYESFSFLFTLIIFVLVIPIFFLHQYLISGILNGWKKAIIFLLFYYSVEIFLILVINDILDELGFIAPFVFFIIFLSYYLAFKCLKHPYYK